MEVFISWSGSQSKAVAEALHAWLPLVIQAVKPWLSARNIGSGKRWSRELSTRLEKVNFGIICCRRNNLNSAWMNFEAGALSKKVQESRVVPYLTDMKPADVPQGPMLDLQMRLAEKDDTYLLVNDINKELGDEALPESVLKDAFETYWPRLEQWLADIPETEDDKKPARNERELLEEILEIVRGLTKGSTIKGIHLDYTEELLEARRKAAKLGLKPRLVDYPEGFVGEKLARSLAEDVGAGEGCITTGGEHRDGDNES